jgi:hypothetical protein
MELGIGASLTIAQSEETISQNWYHIMETESLIYDVEHHRLNSQKRHDYDTFQIHINSSCKHEEPAF